MITTLEPIQVGRSVPAEPSPASARLASLPSLPSVKNPAQAQASCSKTSAFSLQPSALPRQRELALALPSTKPLVHLRTAMDLLDRDEDSILNLILDGQISLAFDIAGLGAAKREIRILARSLDAYKNNHVHHLANLDAVIGQILPPGIAFTASQLKRRLTCNSGHVLNLLAQGLFKPFEGSTAARGPNGSPLITRASATAFLHTRRLS